MRSPTTAKVATPRDLDVLRSLAWAGFLSTVQIAALHFPSRRMAQRRLRALLDLGLVRSRLQGDRVLHEDSLHALSAPGARLVMEHGADPDVARPGRFPSWRAVPHALAVRDAFVAFRIAEREGMVSLQDVLFEGDLARVDELRTSGLVPDAVVELATAGGGWRIALEVDLGTEPMRVLRDKLARYHAVVASGLVHEIAFLVRGERRRLPSEIEAAGLAASTRVVPRADLPAVIRERAQGPYAPPVRAARTA